MKLIHINRSQTITKDYQRVCEPHGVKSVYRKNIVAEVVYHHVHEREAAERVDQLIAVRIILFHIS